MKQKKKKSGISLPCRIRSKITSPSHKTNILSGKMHSTKDNRIKTKDEKKAHSSESKRINFYRCLVEERIFDALSTRKKNQL